MSDDSFIREVNEELRSDQMKALWARYGMLAVAVAALVIVGTAAYVGYDYWSSNRANESGDRFAAALQQIEDGNRQEALDALKLLEEEGYGAYPLLARLRQATVLASGGEADAAVEQFDAVAADDSAPQEIREIARLRAGLLLVDHGSAADVAARVETLTGDAHPMRHLAREALGLAAMKEERMDEAVTLFEQITNDAAAPAGVRQRAEVMLELITASGEANG
ncbi:tetratricopeptide repeat protein [Nitratireductor sp. CH_MIT9313-5]|jgi:hypothetical protein|uniref:tetratricopeptide repeat protein n=1 Tax=Nitratireductor sp. CH_MIT9313-5 TaxID=3107764 RepID=UPI0030090101